MKRIIFEDIHRQKHFDFFNQMNHPYFSLTAMVDISHFYHFIKAQNLSFTPSLVYLICRAANGIDQFRRRIRDEMVVEHPVVHPSFTVLTEVSDVFSFCYVDYEHDARQFIADAEDQMQLMSTAPELEDEKGRDDYLFMSAIPWVHFTSMQHAMQSHPGDSVPRIVWGKYMQNGQRLDLPLSVQVHHAVVDGHHVGTFYRMFQELLDSKRWIN